MAGFAARGHAVGHLVGVVLVVEVDQEQPDLAGQRIAGVAGAQLPGARLLRFNLAAVDRFAHLAVLYGAEGAFGVGVQVPVFVQVIHHVQRRQRRVIANVEAVVLDVVVLIRLDVLVAHARRDSPVADVDAIVDIEGVRLGAGLGIAIVRAGGGRQPAGAGLAGVAQLVGGFADVAVADADLMRRISPAEALAVARFHAAHPVFARRQRQVFALIQIAAAQGVGVEALHVELVLLIRLILIAEVRQLAAAPELVVRARRLERIGVVVRAAQAARHVRFAFVVLQQAVEGVYLVRGVTAFQHHVVNFGRAVLAPVAAAGAGVEQRRAEAVVGGAADHQVAGAFRVILARGRAELPLHAGLHAEGFRDGAGDEVNHAADALRPVAHRAAAAHHVNRIHIAERDRRQRQLRLAVRGEGYWDAVHQHGGAAGEARIEAANAEVQRHVMAAGAVVLRRHYARHAVQRFTHGGGAGFDEVFAAHYVACTGMFEHVDLAAFRQPVADHGDVLFFLWLRQFGQRVAVVAERFSLQAAARQQGVQAVIDAVAAAQARRTFTGGQCAVHRERDAGARGESVQRAVQLTGRNVIGGSGAGGARHLRCSEDQANGHGQRRGPFSPKRSRSDLSPSVVHTFS
ncbi:Uncharacterised protein [Serratia marcescens]|nr:Uncharacterised protein [Serratia marcescens]